MSEIQFLVDHPVAGFVAACRDLPDDRFAYVIESIGWQAQLCIGDKWTCEHRYTYPSLVLACVAFMHWNPEEGEPEGWHRHQPSNRRRPEGDPTLEYVRP